MFRAACFKRPWLLTALILIGAGACSTAVPQAVDASSAAVNPQQAIATQVPNTDIFLFEIDVHNPGLVTGFIGNITARNGYDNQPRFVPKSNDLLFARIVDGQQSEVFSYRAATGEIAQLTSTDLSEYSPTPLTDGSFSTVVVEADGTQRLWHYAADGTPLEPIRSDITGVGYHTYIGTQLLGLFIVAEPVRLDIAGRFDSDVTTIATNIGRSLHAIPGRDELSFVQKSADRPAKLSAWDSHSGKVMALVAMPENVEDMVWLNDGRALAIDGTRLVAWQIGQTGWSVVQELSAYLPGASTRLAVNAQQTRLAIVTEVPQP